MRVPRVHLARGVRKLILMKVDDERQVSVCVGEDPAQFGCVEDRSRQYRDKLSAQCLLLLLFLRQPDRRSLDAPLEMTSRKSHNRELLQTTLAPTQKKVTVGSALV